ncbi:MAG: sucrose synthase, partial [Phormidesmis sp. CAN_BIN36]|nr:sucrose synthase [Phormidesmis sp. CAN_BIN36]
MLDLIQAVLNTEEETDLRQFASLLRASDKRYLLRNEILHAFGEYCRDYEKPEQFRTSSRLSKLIYYVQEIILVNESLCMIIRPQIARQEAYRVLEDLTIEPITPEELLDLRDRFVNHYHPQDGNTFEIDFQPFYDYSPTIRDPKNIGKGVEFLNRYLSSKLFQDSSQLEDSVFNFLRLHRYSGSQLMINERIQSRQQLSDRVKQALSLVSNYPADAVYETFRFDLQNLGFEPGWGNTAHRVQETLEILDRLIDSPDHQALEAFISRIPMIFKVVLVSPHGWFGQEGVLGRPDT